MTERGRFQAAGDQAMGKVPVVKSRRNCVRGALSGIQVGRKKEIVEKVSPESGNVFPNFRNHRIEIR